MQRSSISAGQSDTVEDILLLSPLKKDFEIDRLFGPSEKRLSEKALACECGVIVPSESRTIRGRRFPFRC